MDLCKCNPDAKSTCTKCGGINIVVTSVVDDDDQRMRLRDCEFIVVTKLAGAPFDHFGRVVDGMLSGLLSKVADGWKAEFGTYRLLYLPAHRAELTTKPVHDVNELPEEFGKMRYVLLFGMGKPKQFRRKGLCAFTGFALSTAARCGASKITFMESPHRSTEDNVSLAGTAAIMRCRATLLRTAENPRNLDTIEYLARPQAKPRLLAGLDAPIPQCVPCSFPEV